MKEAEDTKVEDELRDTESMEEEPRGIAGLIVSCMSLVFALTALVFALHTLHTVTARQERRVQKPESRYEVIDTGSGVVCEWGVKDDDGYRVVGTGDQMTFHFIIGGSSGPLEVFYREIDDAETNRSIGVKEGG